MATCPRRPRRRTARRRASPARGVPREPLDGRALTVSEEERRPATRRVGGRRTARDPGHVHRHRSTSAESNEHAAASSSATRSARSWTTRRPPRRCARRTTPSAPSGRASTPTTTRPSTCPTCGWSTCARTRSSTITETGIDTERRVVRVRRDRVRHRLRRDDRCDRRRRHHRPRRADAEGEVGRRAVTLPRADDVRGFPNLFMITGPGQPVGAVEHDRVDRAARRLDRRLPRRTCASDGLDTIEPTELAEARLGASTSTTSPTSR